MGSVQGPIFSNFYMSDLENRIFNSIKKPPIYLRYVDDILILTNNINEIKILQDTFQKNSVLNFTHELNKNNKISFLDVLIDYSILIITVFNITVVLQYYSITVFSLLQYSIIITSLPLLTKNPLVITPVPLTLKVNAPSDIKKKAIINNLISRAKLTSSSKTIFYKEV